MKPQPILETERLILRPLNLQDFDAYVALWQDPEVVRYVTGVPVAREATWSRLLRTAGHWHHLGFGFFAIEEKGSGRFIGETGFQEMLREIDPSIEGTLEAGWGIFPSCQGKGLANEAVSAAIHWAKNAFPSMAMSCIINPENTPSLLLANRLGFTKDCETTYQGHPTVIMRKSASQVVRSS